MPSPESIRLNIIMHEASVLWTGTGPQTSVVGTDYRPYGVNNLYATGGAIFPTSGSWNPTLTMCGLAQNLADQIVSRSNEKHPRARAIEEKTKDTPKKNGPVLVAQAR